MPVAGTVHRALFCNGLVAAQHQQYRRNYRRWQREAPIHLWQQLDLVGGIYLSDGRECKILAGIDDHSCYIVVAVLAVPNGREVCARFTTAMSAHGVPSEARIDNGK